MFLRNDNIINFNLKLILMNLEYFEDWNESSTQTIVKKKI